MGRDRIIQVVAAAVMVLATGISAALLPSIEKKTEDYALRYTDVAVANAPPFVAIGTMIGALRGIIVDYLWIKINVMKEKGLFYEVMADAEMIHKAAAAVRSGLGVPWSQHGVQHLGRDPYQGRTLGMGQQGDRSRSYGRDSL